MPRTSVPYHPFVSVLVFLAVVPVCFILVSCPNPLNETVVRKAKDETAPIITIASPAERSMYTSSISVSGTITDATFDGSVGSVVLCTCTIKGTEVSAEVTLDENGAFLVTLSTAGLTGELEIIVTALDWNGNEATASVKVANDLAGPLVSFTSPSDQSYYAATVAVTGTVQSSSTLTGITEVKSLAYEVLNSSIGGELTFEAGAFSFSFGTTSLNGNLVIRVTAEDWNGNITKTDLTLVDGGSGVPSFTVTPGNGSAVFAWSQVPLSTKYILIDLVNGKEYDGVASPYTLSGLKNGYQYTFKLRSVSSSGSDNYSESISFIPLSSETLVPLIESEYNALKLTWPTIPGTDRYQVLRSTSRNGAYNPVSGSLSNAAFTDRQIARNTLYYYKIKPYDQDDIVSSPSAGITSFFPLKSQRIGVPAAASGGSASWDVAVYGNYAYLAEWYTIDKISILDISNPLLPRYIDSVSLGFSPECLEIEDGYLYVGGTYYVKIYNLSDPESPELEYSYYYAAGTCKDLAVGTVNGDKYLFFASDDNNLKVLKITDLDNVAGPYNQPVAGSPRGIDIWGQYAYVVSTTILQIVDVSDPASMSLENSETLPVPGSHIQVDSNGAYAFVTCAQTGNAASGLYVFDVSDVENIYKPDDWGDGYCITDHVCRDLTLRGNAAYITDIVDHQLLVADISNPDSPQLSTYYALNQEAMGVDLEGSIAYVAISSNGLQTVNIAEPSYPTIKCSLTPGNVQGIDVDGELTAVGLYGGTVNVYNTSTPASPSLKSTTTMPSVVKRLDIRGNKAYVANHLKGLQVVDISDPAHASLTGSFPVNDNSNAADVAVWGDTAFTLHFNSSYMRVVDTSDPSALYPEISRFTIGSSTEYQYGIKVKNQYAYVADTDFRIIDVSDPETPFQVSLEPFAATDGYDVDIQGNFAYIAAGNTLQIIDITDYYDPVLRDSNSQSTAKAIDVSGDYAYVVDGTALWVLDISNPLDIRIVTTVYIGAIGFDVVVQGDYCYVACGTAGWKVIDLYPWSD